MMEELDEMTAYAGDLERRIDTLERSVSDLEAENSALKQECALRAEQVVAMDRERRGWA